MDDIRQVFINNTTMDVISEDEYIRRKQFNEPMFENTCVAKDGIVYPIRPRFTEGLPGVVDAGCMSVYTKPPEERMKDYSEDRVINFSDSKSYAELIKKKDQLANDETARLTTKDNVLEPYIDPNDSPALKLIKEALGAKAIDPESYRQRLGSDFSNCMRLITSKKNKGITLKKLTSLATAYDLDVDITITDKPGCVNPMNKVLKTRITAPNAASGEDGEESD